MSRQFSAFCTLLAGGDVAPNRKREKGMFGETAQLFQKVDLAFVNLEHSLSRGGHPVPGKMRIHRGTPELIEGFVEARFDALAIANNHIRDFGEEGLFETISLLNKHSIPFVGAGRNLSEARKPVILERNGLRIGILAYTSMLPQGFAAGPQKSGVNPLRVKTAYVPIGNLDETPGKAPQILTWTIPEDLRSMQNDIRRLKRKVDVLLVNNHWGVSMVHEVRDFQREIGHAAIDAGADVILGNHPHVLQAVEFYKGRPIVHSLGNFIFDILEPFFTDATLQTFLFGCKLTKGGVRDPYILPCRCGVGDPPKLLSPSRGEGQEIVRMMDCLCKPFGTRLEVKGDRVILIPPAR